MADGRIDTQKLLLHWLSAPDRKLRAVPRVLAVRLPQYKSQGEGDYEYREWLQTEDWSLRPVADWGTDESHRSNIKVFDFRGCCVEGCPGRDQAM